MVLSVLTAPESGHHAAQGIVRGPLDWKGTDDFNGSRWSAAVASLRLFLRGANCLQLLIGGFHFIPRLAVAF